MRKKTLKKLWQKSKLAVLVALGVGGTILMFNSFSTILPEGISVIYQFFLGLGLVLLAGWMGYKK